MRDLILFLAGFILQTTILTAQTQYPTGYFRSPIDFTPSLSGTFAEVRSSHFHSGIDYRTQGVEGKPLYAAAEGFVSRIRISPTGFGKAIYIEHPNGFTTVYAHVRNFIPRIQQYVVNEQYRRESFDVDLYPEPNTIKVEKGEIIAFGGNSGTSSGPHLHFEIRHTRNQNPVNPLLFGLNIHDDIPPVIQAVKVYPIGNYSTVNGQHNPVIFEATGNHGRYKLVNEKSIHVSGDFAIGIQAYDTHNHSNLRNGFKNLSIFIDNELSFQYRINEFSFSETRYVNAVIDYEEFMRSKRRFIQTRVLPNNPLNIYPVVSQGGVFSFAGQGNHKVKIEVKDASGNTAILQFKIATEQPTDFYATESRDDKRSHFRFDQVNRYQTELFVLEIPALALYEDLLFEFGMEESALETVAPLFHVHNIYTPLHRSLTIAIKPEIKNADHLGKALVVRMDDKGEWVPEGGEYIDGYIKASARAFGTFSLMLDTIPPVILPVNIANNKTLGNQNGIRMKISDALSGIKSYRGTMNGSWILMDYDPKNELLIYEIDARMQKGANLFRLEVEDMVGNRSVYEATLNL